MPRGKAGPVGGGRITWEGGDGDQIPKAVGARDTEVERKQGDTASFVSLKVTHAGERRTDGERGGGESKGGLDGATAEAQDGQLGGSALRNGSGDGKKGKARWIPAALRRKTWQRWGIWCWEVRGWEKQA